MNITGLGRASLKVRDLAASERFYSRILRMPVVSRSRAGASAGVEFRVGHANEFIVEPAGELASDDAQERRVRLLLLGKGAVFAHGFDRPLAAGMDEYEQRPERDVGRNARCSFDERAFACG